MKRFFTLFILSGLSLGTLFAQSPITLSNTNMPGNNDTLRYSNAQISSLGNYTQTGTNFNWNFASLIPVSQGVRDFKSALSTPYAVFFLSFTGTGEKITDTLVSLLAVNITNYYLYYRKSTSNPNAYLGDGVGLTINGIPVPSYYSDKDEIYNFPMSYPKYDSTSFRFSTPSSTLIPFVYSSTGNRATRVDGWGTITTPFGTAPCLRLVSNTYSKDSIKTSFLPIPFNTHNRSYQWLTNAQVNGKNVRIPMLEISGNVINNNFTPTTVRYRDNPQVIAGMKETQLSEAINFYPNPVKEHLFFNNDKALDGLEISILDVQGKLVLTKTVHSSDFGTTGSISVNALPTGIYTVQLKKAGLMDGFKFVKE